MLQLCGEPKILGEVKIGRIKWAGHLQRMTEEIMSKRIFQKRQDQRRPKGKPKERWLDSLEENFRRLCVPVEEDRRKWGRVMKELRPYMSCSAEDGWMERWGVVL